MLGGLSVSPNWAREGQSSGRAPSLSLVSPPSARPRQKEDSSLAPWSGKPGVQSVTLLPLGQPHPSRGALPFCRESCGSLDLVLPTPRDLQSEWPGHPVLPPTAGVPRSVLGSHCEACQNESQTRSLETRALTGPALLLAGWGRRRCERCPSCLPSGYFRSQAIVGRQGPRGICRQGVGGPTVVCQLLETSRNKRTGPRAQVSVPEGGTVAATC